jgi:hypothetical protein
MAWPPRAASTQAGFVSDDRASEGVVTDSALGAGAPGGCERCECDCKEQLVTNDVRSEYGGHRAASGACRSYHTGLPTAIVSHTTA